ncbi:hypothetical protein ANN_09748 [Periplaneta americana]|uniref:HAT C-terminal dimerisation domain-containing protein n=1 Tax=Periplaneta americana TaxID=6978 RepID=A0ABQ8TPS0_PERAM|nr:hypothetical protein ANN_09748 [Periplaneta americana]
MVVGKLSPDGPSIPHLVCVKELSKVNSQAIAYFVNKGLQSLYSDIPLPPQPVVTRWGTWIQSVVYYSKYFKEVVTVIDKLPETDSAACVKAVKDCLNDSRVKNDIAYITSNFSFIPASIEQLEREKQSLCSQIAIVKEAQVNIHSALGETGKKASDGNTKRLDEVWVDLFKSTEGELSNLKRVVEFIMCIPGTNACVERLFSRMNALWTDEKNKLLTHNHDTRRNNNYSTLVEPKCFTSAGLKQRCSRERPEASPEARGWRLGSSHARGISSLLKSKLGNEFEVSSVCKPNAPLKNVVEDMMKLSSDFSKRDHVVIVGGPGNRIDNDCNYSIEKDVNNIIEMSSHTNVGFLSLFSRYDKPYLHRRVRSVNMRLERALMRPGASHIGLIDVSPIRRYEYTSHSLHLNGRGTEHLSVLIANSIRGSHVKKQSCNIPVLVNARASPF